MIASVLIDGLVALILFLAVRGVICVLDERRAGRRTTAEFRPLDAPARDRRAQRLH